MIFLWADKTMKDVSHLLPISCYSSGRKLPLASSDLQDLGMRWRISFICSINFAMRTTRAQFAFLVFLIVLVQIFLTNCDRYRKQGWTHKLKEYQTRNKTFYRDGLVYMRAKYLQCACGISNSRKVRGKVVGGQEVDVMAYPWVSHLTHNDGFLLCGGTLITDKHVITAAHCVKELSVLCSEAPELYCVGDHDRSVPWEASSIRVRAVRMVIHPKYDRSSFDNDIAVLTLCRPVITRYIRPACLFAPLYDFSGHPAVVVGWGVTGIFSSLSDTLQQVDIQVVSREMCLRMPLEPFETLTLTESMICAGVIEGGKDACQGDSGGPLMWNYLGRWYVIGIVSKGYGCAEPGKFGIYTKMNKFFNWILYATSDGLQCIR